MVFCMIHHLLIVFTAALQVLAALRIRPPSGPQSMPSAILASLNVTNSTTSSSASLTDQPVNCFNPYLPNLKAAAVEDCHLIIDHILSSYGDPWLPRSFGYTSEVDINLDDPRNEKWPFGRCMVLIKNLDRRRVDMFRMVDIGRTATRILTECVVGKKYPFGGTTEIESAGEGRSFFVAVGGISGTGVTDWTMLSRLSKDLSG